MGKMSITGAEPGVGGRPLERAHAHNDYNHDRPLLDAISIYVTAGFTSHMMLEIYVLVGH